MFACSGKKILLTISSLLISATALGSGGAYFERNRIIIQDGNKSGSIVLKNDSTRSVLVFSRIEDSERVETDKAQSFPRLFKANPAKSHMLRVTVNPSTLPTDKETQFWLYSKFFDQEKVTEQNKIKVNYINRLKVFYRPDGINTDIYEAIKNINWKVKKGRLIAENKYPLNISMTMVTINGKRYSTSEIIRPFSSWTSPIKVDSDKFAIKWSAVNDYGTAIEFERKYR